MDLDEIITQFNNKPLNAALFVELLDFIADQGGLESYVGQSHTVYSVETEEGCVDFYLEGETLKATITPDESDEIV